MLQTSSLSIVTILRSDSWDPIASKQSHIAYAPNPFCNYLAGIGPSLSWKPVHEDQTYCMCHPSFDLIWPTCWWLTTKVNEYASWVADTVHKARLMVNGKCYKNIMFRQWPTKKEEPTRLCCPRNLWIHIWQVEHIPKIHLSCCSWSSEMQHQKSRGEEALAGLPHKRPAAPPVLESPEVASTGANSKRSSTNFFLRTTFIACIAASGMVGTYAIHFESNLFMLEFNPTLSN